MPKSVTRETILYPIVLHREGDTWGYFSPEFGGGGAATQTDAIASAQEMIEAEIAELIEAGESLPAASPIEALDAQGGHVLALPFIVSNAAERIWLTLPKTLLHRVDAVTDNRSAFFAELARERLAGQ